MIAWILFVIGIIFMYCSYLSAREFLFFKDEDDEVEYSYLWSTLLLLVFSIFCLMTSIMVVGR